MAKVTTMSGFKDSVIELAAQNPDIIVLFTDVGYGMHYAPSKKNPAFRLGEVRLPSDALKEEFQNDLHKLGGLNIKTIIFVPKNMASDKVLKLIEEQANLKTPKQKEEPCASDIARETK